MIPKVRVQNTWQDVSGDRNFRMKKGQNLRGKEITFAARIKGEANVGMSISDSNSHPPVPPGAISYTFNVDKLQLPFSFPPVPPTFFPLVGSIAIIWGDFELAVDELIVALLNATGIDEPRWRFKSFRERRRLLIRGVKQQFPVHNTIVEYYTRILDDASNIMWKRNALVHGKYVASIRNDRDGKFTHFITVNGTQNGKEIELSGTLDQIEDIYYEVGHINGRLREMLDTPAACSLPDAEKTVISAFLRDHHPNPPQH